MTRSDYMAAEDHHVSDDDGYAVPEWVIDAQIEDDVHERAMQRREANEGARGESLVVSPAREGRVESGVGIRPGTR